MRGFPVRCLTVAFWGLVGGLGLAACGGGSSGGVVDAAAPPQMRLDAAPAEPVVEAPTWHQDVAPLVMGRCAGCHREGGIAPFSLTSYETARPFAAAMAEAVLSGQMPPWGAEETSECRPRLPWKQDARLSAGQKALLKRWAETGAPVGDANRAAPLPALPSLDLADRNVRTGMAKPYAVEGRRDLFRCFSLPYTFTENVWITGLQVVPGNEKVVHHVLVWLDEKNEGEALAKGSPDGSWECFGAPGFKSGVPSLLGAWAPGGTPLDTPAGVGLAVKKGSRVVINVHYHPTADREMDATSLDLRWTTNRPAYEGLLALIGNATSRDASGNGLQPGPDDPASGPAFVIPPNARDHVELQRFTMPDRLLIGARIWAVGTHMHYVGTDMKIDLDRSNRLGGSPAGEPRSECLVQTPHWDFHWQRGYQFDSPLDNLPTVRTGDVLTMRCRYDNSMANPHVRDALTEQGLSAPREVRLGEQTLDEMCLGIFGLAYQRP